MDDRIRSAPRTHWNRWLRWAACPILTLGLAFGPSGCTRHFFRERADKEVNEVLAEKDQFAKWKIENYHVYPDPKARFADPTCPDRPPMPPDDPAVDQLSPHPQKAHHVGVGEFGGVGYLDLLAKWDTENRSQDAAEEAAAKKTESAKPEPTKPGSGEAASIVAPTEGANGTSPHSFRLRIDQAAELGMINSREFQDRREDLYLTALPVTLERFAFSAQFFAAEQAIREWASRETPGGKQNRWLLSGSTGFAKLFPTGALLLAQFANQTVLNFTGPLRGTTSTSTLTLDAIQPLLRGGGRAVTLEPLTQVERNLLYQIRSYARFRKEFYVSIAGGGGGSISGGVFAPRGVLANTTFSPTGGFGSSGVVPGIFPTDRGANGLQVGPGGVGRLNLAPAIPPVVSGFLGTLLQYAQINIDEENIAKLQGFLKLFEGFREGGEVSQLQVDTVEQQLLGGRITLANDVQQYGDAIDQFKLQLGMPADLPLELDNTPLRGQIRQFARYNEVFDQYEAASNDAGRFFNENQAAQVRAEFHRIFTSSPLVQNTRFRTQIEERWAVWEKLTAQELPKRLAQFNEEHRKLLDRRTDLELKGQTLSEAEQRRLDEIEADIDLGDLETDLRRYESQPWKNENNPQRRRAFQTTAFRGALNSFALALSGARNERLEALRKTWPELPRLCVKQVDLLRASVGEADAAVAQTALENRLDLMNVRAQTVDAWRQIAVFANALLGTFNVEYRMDSFTPPGLAQPVNFSGSRTRHQLILTGDLPLVRKLERNNYRASLIAFQRGRRALMEAEDLAVQTVRGEIRTLRSLAEQYTIQQRLVELAYRTVESSLDTFKAPPQVTISATGASTVQSSAAQAAALTNQLLMAQQSLARAQNNLLTAWVAYLNARLQLFRDLELMPLDQRGVWIDEVATCECPLNAAPNPARLGNPEPVNE